MTANFDVFQSLLWGMREQFLDELAERCDAIDNLIVALEKTPNDREVFNELFRHVHSLKGSGGTHGLSIVTTICHHLENLLTETAAQNSFGEIFATRALAFVDLLRRVEAPGRMENSDYASIESDLEALLQTTRQSRKSALIAESSAVMARIYQKAMDGLPLQVTVVDNGLMALERLVREPFDFAIVGRELKELNGIALMAALRTSQGLNHNIPAIMVSSNRDGIPLHIELAALVARDQNLAHNLRGAVEAVLQA